MNKEVWADVVGYEGYYQVSNMGRVRSLDREIKHVRKIELHKGRILKGCIDNKGYVRVLFSVAGKHKSCLVHRLVAEAFLPNEEALPEVNHKDENPTNNMVENLEWCTKQYNLAYGTGRQRSIQSQHRKAVEQYTLQGEFVAVFESVSEASRQIGKPNDAAAITKCCKGKFRTAYGYVWKYSKAV